MNVLLLHPGTVLSSAMLQVSISEKVKVIMHGVFKNGNF